MRAACLPLPLAYHPDVTMSHADITANTTESCRDRNLAASHPQPTHGGFATPPELKEASR